MAHWRLETHIYMLGKNRLQMVFHHRALKYFRFLLFKVSPQVRFINLMHVDRIILGFIVVWLQLRTSYVVSPQKY